MRWILMETGLKVNTIVNTKYCWSIVVVSSTEKDSKVEKEMLEDLAGIRLHLLMRFAIFFVDIRITIGYT